MEFGRVENLEGVDFTLPPDDALTAKTLPRRHADSTATVFRLGCPLWARREWVGSVYPAGTKPSDYLAAYGAQYGAIELNSTYYSIPSASTIARWCNSVPADFRFCPKVPKTISHAPSLARDQLDAFTAVLKRFGARLGVTFLQLPQSFAPTHKRALADFLAAFPKEYALAIELRHPAWFSDTLQRERLFTHLLERGIGLVLSDVAGRRDVLHMAVTAPFVLVRFCGHQLHETDFSRLDAWSERLANWGERGLRDAYFFMHQPDEMGCDTLARHLGKRLEDRMPAIRIPKLFVTPTQQSLF